MASTQYYLAISLDGFLAEADGTLDWLTKYQTPEAATQTEEGGSSYERFMAGVGAIAMGGRTYRQVFQDWEEPWPYGAIPSWVFTSREEAPPDGSHVEFTHESVADAFPAMAEAAGDKAIWVVGGRDLADQFVTAGLLDELILTVVPVVLGDGIPFLSVRIDKPMRLESTEAFPSGMVELRYRLG